MAESKASFEEAKAFLATKRPDGSGSVYDHLTEILLKVPSPPQQL